MNLTILSLLASSFQSSPFIAGSQFHSISFSKSELSRFLSPSFYNIRNLHVNQAKFSYFQNTPIIYDKEEETDILDWVYYQSPLYNINNETMYIEKTLFTHCQSQNSGGGIHYVNKNGLFDAINTYFYNCVSYMQGGGAYIKCSEIKLDSIIFTLCNGVNSQAGYFETSVYSDFNLILIYNCFISSEVTYMGPVIDINNNFEDSFFSPIAGSINASYNTIRTDILCPLISVRCIGFDYFSTYYMSFFTIFENVCASEIECYGTDFITINAGYFNMIQNHLSRSVFIISGDNYLFASECFIGHDYDVHYFPKQTPDPTMSPFPTIIPPTAPNFTLNNINERRIEEKNLVEHYEFVFNRDTKKFEKVFYVPDEEVDKFVGQANLKKENVNEINFNGDNKFVKNKVLNRYAYQPKYKYDHYINKKVHHRKFKESPEIVLALFPDNSGSIVFADSKIDYPEIDRIECEEQCYMSEFETFEIEEQTLLNVEINFEDETPENQNSVQFKFPTNKMNIVLICIIIAATIFLYVMVMSVACSRLRQINENDLDENNNAV